MNHNPSSVTMTRWQPSRKNDPMKCYLTVVRLKGISDESAFNYKILSHERGATVATGHMSRTVQKV
jgi:hypothetical protein